MGRPIEMFFIWMISEEKKSNRAYEEPKEVTLIYIVYECVLNVHITGIYTFHPFCRDLRILLRDFRGVGPNYYDIT